MNKRDTRRATIAAYQERKVPSGVFAVRCVPTGEAWAAAARCSKRSGTASGSCCGRAAALTRRCRRRGTVTTRTITFEILEELSEDVSEFARVGVLTERAEHWRGELGAQAL